MSEAQQNAQYGELGGGPRYWWRRWKQEKHPLRFLLSRVLWRSRWCEKLPLFIHFPQGHKLKFSPTAMAARLWQEPNFGRSDLEFFACYLRQGERCVDAGANIGFFAVAAAQLVGKNGAVIAIEPHPRIARYLQQNAVLNGHDVRLFVCALGETDAIARFSDVYSDDQNTFSAAPDAIEVPVRRLDDIVNEVWPDEKPIALMKIDVEGYEKFALRGAIQTLKRVQCLYFEVSPPHCRRFGYEPEEIPQFLREHGFTIFRTGEIHFSADKTGVSHSYENLIALRDADDFTARTHQRLELLPV